MSFVDAASGFGTAVGDLFAAQGEKAASTGYSEAATLAEQNVRLSETSTAIQMAQEARKIYSTESATIAAAGGSGERMKGSAADIFRANAEQGALAQGLIGTQGEINQTSYAAAGASYTAQQNQANALAKSDTSSGIMSAIGAVLPIAAMFL